MGYHSLDPKNFSSSPTMMIILKVIGIDFVHNFDIFSDAPDSWGTHGLLWVTGEGEGLWVT